jgi:hypothetical protein
MMRHLLVLFSLCLGLVACQTGSTYPVHPTTATLSVVSGRSGAFVVLDELDGMKLATQSTARGFSLRPGWHQLSASVKTNTGARTGGWVMGDLGRSIGSAIDDLSALGTRSFLSFEALPGRDYLLCVDRQGRLPVVTAARTGQVVSVGR